VVECGGPGRPRASAAPPPLLAMWRQVGEWWREGQPRRPSGLAPSPSRHKEAGLGGTWRLVSVVATWRMRIRGFGGAAMAGCVKD
jgi:hypothetical protein